VQASNKLYSLVIYLILALAIIIAFEQVCRNQFVGYDDDVYVTENPQVKGGITRESVIWAFTTAHSANWHPLTWLSHMLDCDFFELNPLGHHLSSLLFHIANTLLLFWVLKRMTGALWRSAFVAAAFALHPLHVESVAWVAERKDVLSGFFWMLTMAAYIRYAERPGLGRYVLVFLFLCLGLMAKPMLVTLPFVLLLLDYWPLGRFQWSRQDSLKALSKSSVNVGVQGMPASRLVAEKIPLFVLSSVSSVVTFLVQRSSGVVVQIEKLSLNARIANTLVSYIKYIGKMIYPRRLAVLYPHPGHSLPLWQPMVCFMVLAVVSAGIIYAARRRRYLVVGWLWYVGTLVPVIGLVQVGMQAMADRYTYLPIIGLFIIIAWGASELFGRWRLQKIVLGISAGIVLAVLLICTRVQVRYWHNDFTLYGHTLAVTRNNYTIHYNLGVALKSKGRVDEAISHYRKALQFKPNYADVHNNLGVALKSKGEVDEAISHYRKALQFEPGHASAHYNLGITLQLQGKLDEAISHYRKALQSKPDYANAHNNLGVALKSQDKLDEAISHYRKALQFEPDHASAHNNLGVALQLQGELEESVKHYRKAVQFNPQGYVALKNLGIVLVDQGKCQEAIKHLNEALRVKPDKPEAHHYLALAYAQLGKYNLAITHWTEAVKLKPDFADALKSLAWTLASQENPKFRNPDEAIRLAMRCCELTEFKKPVFLDTLAVAYAAAGRFDQALETAQKALNLAQSAGKKDLAQDIRSRLELYKTAQPYRETAPAQDKTRP
jgi:tetratricopeptide (TPR) repeat protein